MKKCCGKESLNRLKLLDRDYKLSLLISWVIWGLAALAYLVMYVPYSIKNEIMGTNVIVITVVIGACVVCVLARPFMDKSSLLKKTTFVLTNHRSIVCSGDNVKTMFIDADTPCKLVKLENGTEAVMMGTAVNSPMRKSRSNSLTGIVSEKDRSDVVGMVFYSVKNAKKVCDSYAPFKTV